MGGSAGKSQSGCTGQGGVGQTARSPYALIAATRRDLMMMMMMMRVSVVEQMWMKSRGDKTALKLETVD